MTVLDDKIIPIVADSLATYGKVATIRSYIVNEYSPSTGEVIKTGLTSYPVLIVPPEPFERTDDPAINALNASLVTYVSGQALPVELQLEMEFIVDGETFILVRFDPVYSGELIALYRLYLRKT